MRPPDPDNRRRQVAKILRSARRLFARDGYDRVSMDRIAAACGSTKPVLYYYFENKRAVLLAVLEAHWAEKAALLEAFLAVGGPASDAGGPGPAHPEGGRAAGDGRRHPHRPRGGRAPPGDRPGLLPDDRTDLRETAARRDPSPPLSGLDRGKGARALPPVRGQPGALLPPPAGLPARTPSPARAANLRRSRGRHLRPGQPAPPGAIARGAIEETGLLPLLLRDDPAVRPGLPELHDAAQRRAGPAGALHGRRPSAWCSTS